MLFLQHMKLLFVLLSVVLLTSCGQYPLATLDQNAGAIAAPSSPLAKKRKIQRTGQMSMKSRDLKASADKSVALVQSRQGLITSSSLTKNDYQATVRVPDFSLAPLMESLQELGRVTDKRITAADVTGQHLDLQALLKNKRALRDRLRKLLTQSTNVKDTLKIQKELTKVQAELDQLTSRMNNLETRVVYSTLSLSIKRERIPGPLGLAGKSFGWLFGKLFQLN